MSYLEKIALTKLIIEDVWFDNSSRVLRIFIANVGELEFVVNSVIVNGRLWSSNLDIILYPSTHYWLNITFPGWFILKEGVYEILVVTIDGLKFKGVVYVGG